MSAQAVVTESLPLGVPASGTTLAGKYRVDGLLGTGGMGVILHATELSSERRVAVKVMTSAASTDPEQVTRFRREAKAASSLTSEHVVRVLDHGELESGLPYLVMELLEGESLADLSAKRGPLPCAEAVDYVLQAAHGIAEAHALGIVHRDLKPANLFVTGDADAPVIKVLDFGASKVRGGGDPGGVTMASSLIGSPRYMAPEQIRSALEVDARADVYALGATLHELLTGKPIFFADTLARIFAQVLWEEAEPISASRDDVPVALADVVGRCLAKAPEERYQAVEALAAALAPFASPKAAAESGRMLVAARSVVLKRKSTMRMERVKMSSEAPKRTVRVAAFALAAHLGPVGAVARAQNAEAAARAAGTMRMARFVPPSAPTRAALSRRTLVIVVLLLVIAATFAAIAIARHRAHARSAVTLQAGS